MTKLTTKQEKFVNEWIATGNKTRAYKSAYSCKKWKEETINKRASELSKKKNILGRYQALMKIHQEKALYTRKELLIDLKKALEMAIGDKSVKLFKIVNGQIIQLEVHKTDLAAFNQIINTIAKLEGWDKKEEESHNIEDPLYLAEQLKKLSSEKLTIVMNAFSS